LLAKHEHPLAMTYTYPLVWYTDFTWQSGYLWTILKRARSTLLSYSLNMNLQLLSTCRYVVNTLHHLSTQNV